MTTPISPKTRGTLIAHADDVANSLIEKWGRAVVGEPRHNNMNGWHVEVIGLLGDIQMDTILVLSNGARQVGA